MSPLPNLAQVVFERLGTRDVARSSCRLPHDLQPAMANSPDGKNGKDMAWYNKLGAAVKERVGGKDQLCVHPEWVGDVPDEPRQWKGFEFAEALEQGLGPGLSSSYIDPPAESTPKEQRLVVVRNPTRSSYSLLDDTERTMLVAKTSQDGCRFEIYVARDGQPPLALGPAFTMVAGSSARDHWVLTCVRCDRCESRGKRQCGQRELMRLCHYVETVGDGQAFCMDVDLPAEHEDGSRSVLCECCGDASRQYTTALTARRPKWNPKHKSLTLDFNGRCSMASAKNFQLEDPSNPGKTKLLFGKIAEQRFTLDFRYPLSTVQAFAAVLSTSHWK